MRQLQENFYNELNEIQNFAAAEVQELLQDKSSIEELSQFKNQNYWIVKNLFANNQSSNFIEAFFSISVAVFTEIIESIANIFWGKEKSKTQEDF